MFRQLNKSVRICVLEQASLVPADKHEYYGKSVILTSSRRAKVSQRNPAAPRQSPKTKTHEQLNILHAGVTEFLFSINPIMGGGMITLSFPQDSMIPLRQSCTLFTPASQTWMEGGGGVAHEKPAVFLSLFFFHSANCS